MKARSLSLLTCTYVETIGCKLPSTYVGAKCYSLIIAFIIERISILRVSVVWHQHNLLQGGTVWGGVMAIGCKRNSTTLYFYFFSMVIWFIKWSVKPPKQMYEQSFSLKKREGGGGLNTHEKKIIKEKIYFYA